MDGQNVLRASTDRLIRRDAQGYERIVMAELLIPNVPNVYGDIYTEEMIRDFVEQYAAQGYGLDVNHDGVNVAGQELLLVESFIARPGDPDFIPGSWVLGMKVLSDDVWQRIIDGNLNGFSFGAECLMTEVVIESLTPRDVSGVTEPYLPDGHTHTYFALLDNLNNVVAGGTGVTDGHSHRIAIHSVTQESNGHVHRFQVIYPQSENADE